MEITISIHEKMIGFRVRGNHYFKNWFASPFPSIFFSNWLAFGFQTQGLKKTTHVDDLPSEASFFQGDALKTPTQKGTFVAKPGILSFFLTCYTPEN